MICQKRLPVLHFEKEMSIGLGKSYNTNISCRKARKQKKTDDKNQPSLSSWACSDMFSANLEISHLGENQILVHNDSTVIYRLHKPTFTAAIGSKHVVILCNSVQYIFCF